MTTTTNKPSTRQARALRSIWNAAMRYKRDAEDVRKDRPFDRDSILLCRQTHRELMRIHDLAAMGQREMAGDLLHKMDELIHTEISEAAWQWLMAEQPAARRARKAQEDMPDGYYELKL